MKNLKYLILCVITMITQLVFAYDFEADGFYFDITNQSTNEVAVTYKTTSYNSYSGVINIPSSVVYNGSTYTVTSIGSYAFRECTRLISVTIPNSVTSIGQLAFYDCTNIKSLTIGSGVTLIGNYAFSTSSTIPKVIWLGNTPPSGDSDIWADVNYVSNSEFQLSNPVVVYPFLSSLFEVDGVVYVPVSPSDRTCDVIDCNYNLTNTELKIDSLVVNKNVELKVLNVNDYAFYENPKITKLEISNRGFIGSYAFSDCDALTSVVANNNGYIGTHAFYNCDALNSVVANNNGYIGASAFRNCDALTSVVANNNGYIGTGAFYDCAALTSVVANNNGYIGEAVFYKCAALTSVSLGANITTIGEDSFRGNSLLESISIPDNVTSLGADAFADCTSLKNVSIGRGIPSLPKYIFENCSSLPSIFIPNNIDNIDNYAFYGCTNLGDVTFEELKTHGQRQDLSPIKLGSNGSSPLFSSCKLDEVYIGRKLSYNTSSGYGYSPFYRNTSLRKVTITDAETQIYDNEFYGCSNLQEFSCGDGVTSIGKWAFSGCTSLESYVSGTSVESIGQEAFSDCTAMTSFTSNAEVPPVCGTQALDDINKWECTLYVPQESIDDYQAAPQWKEFFFIDKSGVEDIFVDNEETTNQPVEIYNLSGVKIGNSTETLSPGLYIKRQGNKTEKIMIK